MNMIWIAVARKLLVYEKLSRGNGVEYYAMQAAIVCPPYICCLSSMFRPLPIKLVCLPFHNCLAPRALLQNCIYTPNLGYMPITSQISYQNDRSRNLQTVCIPLSKNDHATHMIVFAPYMVLLTSILQRGQTSSSSLGTPNVAQVLCHDLPLIYIKQFILCHCEYKIQKYYNIQMYGMSVWNQSWR